MALTLTPPDPPPGVTPINAFNKKTVSYPMVLGNGLCIHRCVCVCLYVIRYIYIYIYIYIYMLLIQDVLNTQLGQASCSFDFVTIHILCCFVRIAPAEH